jgi:hypothetical protein
LGSAKPSLLIVEPLKIGEAAAACPSSQPRRLNFEQGQVSLGVSVDEIKFAWDKAKARDRLKRPMAAVAAMPRLECSGE